MSIYDYEANTLRGQEESMSKYKGKVLLVVNTASKCGFTPSIRVSRRSTINSRTAVLKCSVSRVTSLPAKSRAQARISPNSARLITE